MTDDKQYLVNNMVGFILGYADSLPTCDACGPFTYTNDEVRAILREASELPEETLNKLRADTETQLRFMRKNKERVQAVSEQFRAITEDSMKEPKLRLVE